MLFSLIDQLQYVARKIAETTDKQEEEILRAIYRTLMEQRLREIDFEKVFNAQTMQ